MARRTSPRAARFAIAGLVLLTASAVVMPGAAAAPATDTPSPAAPDTVDATDPTTDPTRPVDPIDPGEPADPGTPAHPTEPSAPEEPANAAPADPPSQSRPPVDGARDDARPERAVARRRRSGGGGGCDHGDARHRTRVGPEGDGGRHRFCRPAGSRCSCAWSSRRRLPTATSTASPTSARMPPVRSPRRGRVRRLAHTQNGTVDCADAPGVPDDRRQPDRHDRGGVRAHLVRPLGSAPAATHDPGGTDDRSGARAGARALRKRFPTGRRRADGAVPRRRRYRRLRRARRDVVRCRGRGDRSRPGGAPRALRRDRRHSTAPARWARASW